MATISGLYIGGDALSLVSLKSTKKGWAVEAGGMAAHAAGETDDLGPAIKGLCKSLKVSGSELTAILPKQQGILRNVQLPSTERDELVQMARFEAERHIPFHAERHSTGYHIMRSMGVEGSDVVLGAVDGPIVQRALDGVVHGGLTPRGIALSSVALVNSLIHEKREWIKGKTVVLMALGLDALDLVLLCDGRLIFARSVTMDLRSVLECWAGYQGRESGAPRPDAARLATAARMVDCLNLEGHYGTGGTGATTKDAADLVRTWVERVIQEMRRTYDFARREMKCPPVDAVALTGEGSLLRNLNQYLYVNLNIEIMPFNPVATMPGAAELKFPFEGLEFVIPFGGAISHMMDDAYQLDLTPSEYYRQLARRRTMRQLMMTAVILAITLGLSVAAWFRFQEISRREMTAYASTNELMKPKAAALEEMQAKLKIMRGFIDDPNSALVVLNGVAASKLIPAQVTLNSLNYEKGKDLALEGYARTIPDISNFTQELRGTGHFLEILTDQNPYELFGQHFYSFKLQCPLSGAEKDSGGKGGQRS